MTRRRDADDEADDRPPICPACGVTQGMVITDDEPQFVCQECGFSDSESAVD
jgi:transcription initiation factor TFIIIB Brf1 subunit/transcription initiation factor TFIIB